MILEAALSYVNRGFSVAPVEPRGKKPLIMWQRYQTERAEPSEIKKWFADSPAANVGIVTGAISDLVVVDIDTDEARTGLKQIVGDCDLDGVPRSRTGKGWQLFFKHPGVIIQNRAGAIPALARLRRFAAEQQEVTWCRVRFEVKGAGHSGSRKPSRYWCFVPVH